MTGPIAPDPANTDTPTMAESTVPQDPPTGNAEAARYRVRLREAEDQRDTLRTVVAAMGDTVMAIERERDTARRELVERHLAATFADPAEFWSEVPGIPIADDGTIDTATVDRWAAAILERHPHWRLYSGPAVLPTSLIAPGAGSPYNLPPGTPRQTGWANVLQGKTG